MSGDTGDRRSLKKLNLSFTPNKTAVFEDTKSRLIQ